LPPRGAEYDSSTQGVNKESDTNHVSKLFMKVKYMSDKKRHDSADGNSSFVSLDKTKIHDMNWDM
jgi:hypothetical protein